MCYLNIRFNMDYCTQLLEDKQKKIHAVDVDALILTLPAVHEKYILVGGTNSSNGAKT